MKYLFLLITLLPAGIMQAQLKSSNSSIDVKLIEVNKQPIQLKANNVFILSSDAWLIDNERMLFYQELHQYFRDSMPELTSFSDQYESILQSQEADYMKIRDSYIEYQFKTRLNLRQTQSILNNAKSNLNALQLERTKLTQLSQEIEANYKKSRKKSATFLGKAAWFAFGGLVGYAIVKF